MRINPCAWMTLQKGSCLNRAFHSLRDIITAVNKAVADFFRKIFPCFFSSRVTPAVTFQAAPQPVAALPRPIPAPPLTPAPVKVPAQQPQRSPQTVRPLTATPPPGPAASLQQTAPTPDLVRQESPPCPAESLVPIPPEAAFTPSLLSPILPETSSTQSLPPLIQVTRSLSSGSVRSDSSALSVSPPPGLKPSGSPKPNRTLLPEFEEKEHEEKGRKSTSPTESTASTAFSDIYEELDGLDALLDNLDVTQSSQAEQRSTTSETGSPQETTGDDQWSRLVRGIHQLGTPQKNEVIQEILEAQGVPEDQVKKGNNPTPDRRVKPQSVVIAGREKPPREASLWVVLSMLSSLFKSTSEELFGQTQLEQTVKQGCELCKSSSAGNFNIENLIRQFGDLQKLKVKSEWTKGIDDLDVSDCQISGEIDPIFSVLNRVSIALTSRFGSSAKLGVLLYQVDAQKEIENVYGLVIEKKRERFTPQRRGNPELAKVSNKGLILTKVMELNGYRPSVTISLSTKNCRVKKLGGLVKAILFTPCDLVPQSKLL